MWLLSWECIDAQKIFVHLGTHSTCPARWTSLSHKQQAEWFALAYCCVSGCGFVCLSKGISTFVWVTLCASTVDGTTCPRKGLFLQPGEAWGSGFCRPEALGLRSLPSTQREGKTRWLFTHPTRESFVAMATADSPVCSLTHIISEYTFHFTHLQLAVTSAGYGHNNVA